MTDSEQRQAVSEHPPGASAAARRVSRAVMRPLERFIHVQAASGIVLVAAAAAGIVWANSPWRSSYVELLATRFRLDAGPWTVTTSLQFLIGDVLMAIFFLVIGLELRRELHGGELGTPRRAALPLLAALGGMVVPAAIYLAIAGLRGEAAAGWGVAVSTDTAFALGVLALLGTRVMPSLRVLLLAIAIIDDVLAIVIIAIFYSAGIELRGLAVAAGGVAAILVLQRFGVRLVTAYAAPAIVVWFGVWWAGVQPTIAGIIVGLLTPASTWYGVEGLEDAARHHVEESERHAGRRSHGSRLREFALTKLELQRAHREAVSPVERVETALHTWAAFVVMPLFAFANAGIDFRRVTTTSAPRLLVGVAAGLVVGKFLGIVLASAGVVKLGLAKLPNGVTWRGMAVIGAVAGVGFTMSLFITNLAFTSRELRDVATVAVLGASVASAVIALVLGRMLLVKGGRAVADEEAAS